MVGRRGIWGKFTNQADPSALVINYCFNLQVSKILSQAIINYLQLFKFSSKGNRGEGRGGGVGRSVTGGGCALVVTTSLCQYWGSSYKYVFQN